MSKNLCLNLLSGDSFLQINTSLTHYFDGDLDALFVLSFLISQYKYLNELDQIGKDGYFYSTVEFIESKCHLSEYRQREAIRRLEKKHELLKTKKKGIPSKRFILLDFDKIVALLSKEEPVVRDQETFYKNLNDALEKDWKDFRVVIGRINRSTALGIFFWSKLYKKKFNKSWIWDSEQFGIYNMWFKMKLKTGEIDYSVIQTYIDVILTESDLMFINPIILKKFRTWEKGVLPLAPALRLTDPIQVLEQIKEI